MCLFLHKPVIAQTPLSVTATVQPSKEWKQAIRQYSRIALETPNLELLKPVKISIISKGPLDQTIPNQKIKIKVVDDNNINQEAILSSNQLDVVGFTFVPIQYGNYLIQAENITYEKSISLIPLQISIQKKESIVDFVLKLFQEKT